MRLTVVYDIIAFELRLNVTYMTGVGISKRLKEGKHRCIRGAYFSP